MTDTSPPLSAPTAFQPADHSGYHRVLLKLSGETFGGGKVRLANLIAYGDLRSDGPDLLLPHPRAAERDFVLEPWLSIDPEATLPGSGRVDALLAKLRGDR